MADDPSAIALKSITEERDALKAENIALRSTMSEPSKKIEELESTIKQIKEQSGIMIKSAIEVREAEFERKIKEMEETAAITSELRSMMRKDTLEKILSTKPSVAVLKNILDVNKASGLSHHAGVGIGETDLKSTVPPTIGSYDPIRKEWS